MKKVLVVFILLFIAAHSFAQVITPVKWSYASKKLDPATYEVHITATISGNWHIYSQTTPDGGPVPTTIVFTKNPLITIEGKSTEVGKLQQKHEPLFDVDVKQYSQSVDFVQTVKLKKPVKTNLNGTIEFMVCNDRQCLPPSTQKFSIEIK